MHALNDVRLPPDLIARLLANPSALQDSTPATATETASTESAPEPAASTETAQPAAQETTATTEAPAPAVSATTIEDEVEKRKKRAARFGVPANAEASTNGGDSATQVTGPDDVAKSVERAKRFGTANEGDAAVDVVKVCFAVS